MNTKQPEVIALTILLLSATGGGADTTANSHRACTPSKSKQFARSAAWRSSRRRFPPRATLPPRYLPPIGQDLRLTIVSTDENGPTTNGERRRK